MEGYESGQEELKCGCRIENPFLLDLAQLSLFVKTYLNLIFGSRKDQSWSQAPENLLPARSDARLGEFLSGRRYSNDVIPGLGLVG